MHMRTSLLKGKRRPQPKQNIQRSKRMGEEMVKTRPPPTKKPKAKPSNPSNKSHQSPYQLQDSDELNTKRSAVSTKRPTEAEDILENDTSGEDVDSMSIHSCYLYS